MITKNTIDLILDTARIDEVVGDYVTLKKRGVNYLGNCPFHNEKTPSFTVSPTKGIYKCFGCGKAGDSVRFVMDHLSLSYPDALRELARRYNIEIVEEKVEYNQQQQEEHNEKEALYVVSNFAQKYFTQNLLETEEGRAIGLSYFKERGFDAQTIEKFQLGYCKDSWNDFTQHASAEGYKIDILVKAGLTKQKENGNTFDFFSGRVIFPIHNGMGRVIGFGGRTLKTDKSVAKYFNSPESLIYYKSKVLYGLHLAKKSIQVNDNCFLVEGYTDVISMHNCGIENVVASSGTSLTEDQIKIIKRLTPNITILYDGDFAGIKASMRGIEMILKEGMNVKIVLFPDGEDPDSFSRKNDAETVLNYIKTNASDFVTFKAKLGWEEVKDDPIKKSTFVRDILKDIALIEDGLIREEYIRECSRIFNSKEETLFIELGKIRRENRKKQNTNIREELNAVKDEVLNPEKELDILVNEIHINDEIEKEIVRLILLYGHKEILVDFFEEIGEKTLTQVSGAEFIAFELTKEHIEFQHPVYKAIYLETVKCLEEGRIINPQLFLRNDDESIKNASIEISNTPYHLSDNWSEKHGIYVKIEANHLESFLRKIILKAKLFTIKTKLEENKKILSAVGSEGDFEEVLSYSKNLLKIQVEIGNLLGMTILNK